MSRILVWSPNYAPELTGIPPLVTDACEWLTGRGHEVEVVTALPNYPDRVIHDEYRGRLWRSERCGRVAVHRSWLRVRPAERVLDKALYEASFAALSAPIAMRRARHKDVVLCVVPSLAAGIAATIIARTRRIPCVLWIQDLVLKAAESLDGLGRPAHAALGLARRAEAVALKTADRVLVCNPAFAEYAVASGTDPARLRTIFNWVDLERITPKPARAGSSTRFLYAGNIGYTQGLDALVEAARLAGPGVEVAIVGRGNSEARVAALAARTRNVRVSAPVCDADYPELLGHAHAHVVIQRAVGADANFPSKIASYLASGRPLVASMEPDSAAARMLAASGAALVVPPDDPLALANALRRLHAEPALRAQLGRRARAYAERQFGREQALAELEDALVRWQPGSRLVPARTTFDDRAAA